ncbi:MAG: ribonuclease J [Clostridiales bacterium]|nr:ribonuclease J [Clostridiales bacterium]
MVTRRTGKLKVIPLGGLNEIGKNMTLFECGEEAVIVDCGVSFPEEDMLGIDLVIPDFSYCHEIRNKLKGIVLTHGHEDHIGALPYFLKEINIPIYGTRLTIGLVESKLREHGILNNVGRYYVNAGETIHLGRHFKVEFIHTNHSIADSAALAIKTPVGVVIHSGDFKVDYTPIDGEIINLRRFAELGGEGVLLFMCESTNVELPGYTLSEKSVGAKFDQIFRETPENRIMVATFSSNVHRIQQIMNSAYKYNRKVAVIGRSMSNVVKTAIELGYMTPPPNTLIDITEIGRYEDNRVVIVMTGSQGETMSALSRIAQNDHKQVDVRTGDKIIISASPIPGNEKAVYRLINDLLKKGAEVIYEGIMDVHVSGHARQEEIKLLHSLVKPEFFVPIHGEFKMLKTHARLAEDLGVNKKNVFVLGLGDVLELDRSRAKITGSVPTGQVFVDGLGVGDVGNIVIRDRRHLSQDGLMIVVVAMERNSGRVVSGPDIISRGFVYVRESEALMEGAREVVREALDMCEDRNITEWTYIKSLIKDTLKDYIWKKTKRSPMILPIIMDIV